MNSKTNVRTKLSISQEKQVHIVCNSTQALTKGNLQSSNLLY